MIKLIQISDLHLTRPTGLVFGTDPLSRLDACLAEINAHHADADLVVFSGDLANDGEEAAYRALADRLAGLKAPFRLMLGNHDDRNLFQTVFPHSPAEGGFVQSTLDIGDSRIVLLDTLEHGRAEGHLGADRLAWLDAALADAGGRHAYVFMHHPPAAIHVPALDGSRLTEPEAFAAVIGRHGNVRHIFAGHVHRPVSGTWNGIPFSTLPGTNHQSAATFGQDHYLVSAEPPGYGVILIEPQSVVVHNVGFAIAAGS